jgi:peroxiredoxin Q/BCP
MTGKMVLASALAFALAGAAAASLPVGAKAPDIATQASLDGKATPFSLKTALRKGPVVLYFFPAAFTQGCTIEAHAFAEASDDFHKLGATVVGMSGDPIETLNKFSLAECRSKFAVASASAQTINAYDVVLRAKPNLSNRTSYVIAPDGKILYAYSALDPLGHIEGTMNAVKAWRSSHPRKRG